MSLQRKRWQHWIGRARARTPSLGERELAVLGVLWRASPLTAQQVLEDLPGRGVSLSTIQSTLERLHRKGVLERRKEVRAFVYAPRVERQDLVSSLLHDIADDIAGGDLATMLSGFMEFLGDERGRMAALLDAERSSAKAPADDADADGAGGRERDPSP